MRLLKSLDWDGNPETRIRSRFPGPSVVLYLNLLEVGSSSFSGSFRVTRVSWLTSVVEQSRKPEDKSIQTVIDIYDSSFFFPGRIRSPVKSVSERFPPFIFPSSSLFIKREYHTEMSSVPAETTDKHFLYSLSVSSCTSVTIRYQSTISSLKSIIFLVVYLRFNYFKES